MIVYFDDIPHNHQQFGLTLLKGKEMSLFPDAEPHLIDIAGKAGSYLFSSSFREKRFKFPFAFAHESKDDELNSKIQVVKEFFLDNNNQLRDVRMHFSFQPDRFYKVRLTGATPMSREFQEADIELEFIASDPYAYGRVPYSEKTLSYAGFTHSFSQIATPVLTFTLKNTTGGTEFAFECTTSDNKVHRILISYDLGFRSGDVIQLDLSKNSLTINGTTAMRYLNWQESDFFTMPKGITQFKWNQYWEMSLDYVPKWI